MWVPASVSDHVVQLERLEDSPGRLGNVLILKNSWLACTGLAEVKLNLFAHKVLVR